MAMNHANSQYNTSNHVDVGQAVRKARTGTVANASVPTVASFLQNPTPTFITPHAFNAGHLLPPTDITGAPYPMTSTARSAVWSQFAANTGKWYQGFHPRPPMGAPGPTYGDSSHPGLPYL